MRIVVTSLARKSFGRFITATLFAAFFFVTGCGHKGPLKAPERPSEVNQPAAITLP